MAVRVHELARELGVQSKDILSTLKDMGEYVKSASSTVEAPVVRRLKEEHGDTLRDKGAKKAAKKAPAAKPEAPAQAETKAPEAPAPVEQPAAAEPAAEAPAPAAPKAAPAPGPRPG
ncbi:MAG: translation initiation factor IF-2 N-terminal domain-containing protein, partial [Aeromicrobium sp.]